jgi:hypothetical protein
MSLDSADKTHGNFALKISKPNGAGVRLMSENAVPVSAGETIRVSTMCKTNPGGCVIGLGIYTGASEGAAQLFGGGGAQERNFLPSTYWKRFSADFVIPAGHSYLRPYFLPWTIGAFDFTAWLDDTRSERVEFIPWISIDGSTPGSSNLFTNSWVNFGGAKLTAQYRKVFDDVELRGTIKSGTVNTSAFTLPSGVRPSAEISFPIDANGAHGQVVISSSGTVTCNVASNVSVSLDGVYFSTL